MSNVSLEPGERLARVGEIDLCYQTFGRDTDPALLLVMGLGAQMIQWDDEFCEQLAGRGYFVIRFDNRDIGKSSRIAVTPGDLQAAYLAAQKGQRIAAPYLLKDMAADAIGLLDHLGIARAHVVGASMGGMIAQEIALGWPNRAASLTSIMSTTGDPSMPPPAPEAAAIFFAPPPKTINDFINANVAAWNIMRRGAFLEEAARDFNRAQRAAMRGPLSPEGGARQWLAVMASGDRTARLAGLEVPTLVIHGIDDPLVRIEAGRATARAIPGAKLVEIAQMGHALPRAVWPHYAGWQPRAGD